MGQLDCLPICTFAHSELISPYKRSGEGFLRALDMPFRNLRSASVNEFSVCSSDMVHAVPGGAQDRFRLPRCVSCTRRHYSVNGGTPVKSLHYSQGELTEPSELTPPNPGQTTLECGRRVHVKRNHTGKTDDLSEFETRQDQAIRLVFELRKEFGTAQGTAIRFADQLRYGTDGCAHLIWPHLVCRFLLSAGSLLKLIEVVSDQ